MSQGLVMKIPPEDYFTEKLTEIRDLGLRWADTAKQVIISCIIHRESASILSQMIILLILCPSRCKQVSADGGVLGLDRVFALIYEGESLPVSCEKELKVIMTAKFSWTLNALHFSVILSLLLLQLLKDRSMLYCICRRPYGERAMIACDKCDEWYHFDCVKISSAPKFYICPACNPCLGEDTPPSVAAAQDRQVVIVLYDGFSYRFYKICTMKGDL